MSYPGLFLWNFFIPIILKNMKLFKIFFQWITFICLKLYWKTTSCHKLFKYKHYFFFCKLRPPRMFSNIKTKYKSNNHSCEGDWSRHDKYNQPYMNHLIIINATSKTISGWTKKQILINENDDCPITCWEATPWFSENFWYVKKW